MNFQIKYHCCFFSCCEILARYLILGRKNITYNVTSIIRLYYFMSFNNYLLCEPYDEIWLIGVKDYSAFLHTCICICQVTISYYLHSIIKISNIHKINIFVNWPSPATSGANFNARTDLVRNILCKTLLAHLRIKLFALSAISTLALTLESVFLGTTLQSWNFHYRNMCLWYKHQK